MTELSQAERTAMGEAFHAYDASSIGLPPTNSFSAAWSLGRDYGRERERALEEALKRIAELDGWKRTRPSLLARAAIAASQPEVLSERSDPERCAYCGESLPAPIELHHAEADCAGLKENRVGEIPVGFRAVHLSVGDWERLLGIAQFTFTPQDERILNTIQTAIAVTGKLNAEMGRDPRV